MRHWGVIGLAAVGMIACERPTAPQVRDAADQVERKILSGDSTQLHGAVGTLLVLPMWYDTSHFVPSDTIRIIRDGQEILLRATMMERVYLPPPGSFARPVMNRMGLAWSADATHDTHRMRLLVLNANDPIPLINAPEKGWLEPSAPEMRYQHATFVVNVEPSDRHEWIARDGGNLTISDGVPVGSCPFTDHFTHSPGVVGGVSPTAAAITCDTRRYTISVSATMEHNNADGSTVELRLPRQETRGVKIVTQCTGVQNKDPGACWGFPMAKPE
jgi:hypothetical protein